MHHVFTRLSLATLALLGVTVAQATPAVTTLSFSSLLNFSTHMTLDHTVGGTLEITPVGGKLLVNVLGELGVAHRVIGDYSINRNEGILFNFSQKVSLTGWDMDSLPGGKNTFSLKVDGGAVQSFNLNSPKPGTALVGSSFQFGWLGESYFIDSVQFTAWAEPVKPNTPGPLVTAVPEPSTAALMVACGGVLAFVARRQSKA
jgi:PEP-CTERM motif